MDRRTEIALIERFIETQGVTVLEPFEEGQVSKEWRQNDVKKMVEDRVQCLQGIMQGVRKRIW